MSSCQSKSQGQPRVEERRQRLHFLMGGKESHLKRHAYRDGRGCSCARSLYIYTCICIDIYMCIYICLHLSRYLHLDIQLDISIGIDRWMERSIFYLSWHLDLSLRILSESGGEAGLGQQISWMLLIPEFLCRRGLEVAIFWSGSWRPFLEAMFYSRQIVCAWIMCWLGVWWRL